MRTISCKLEDLKNMTLHIGYEGENDYTSVRIDAGSVFAEYPEAVATMKVQPPKGNMYPVIVSREGDIVVWNVKDSDTASNGNGEIQLTFTEGTVVRKSCTGKTIVHRSLKATGPAPDPLADFIDTAEEVLDDLEAMDTIAKNAQAGDIGKALSPKTVENGVVTEWQYVEPGGGTEDYTDLENKPSIGGVTLTGDKSLADLGIASAATVNDLAEDVADVKSAIDGLDERVAILEGNVDYELIETDTDTSFTKTVPAEASKAEIESTGTKSIVYNQHFPAVNTTSNGLEYTTNASTGWIKVYGQSSGNGGFRPSGSDVIPLGHKAACIIETDGIELQTSLSAGFELFISGGPGYNDGSVKGEKTESFIHQTDSYTWGISFRCGTGNNIDGSIRVQLFDITAMFGAGNEPSTLSDFLAIFTGEYYAPDSTGTTVAVSCDKILLNGVEQSENSFNVEEDDVITIHTSSSVDTVLLPVSSTVNYYKAIPKTNKPEYVTESEKVATDLLNENADLRIMLFTDNHDYTPFKYDKYADMMSHGIVDYLVGLGDYKDYGTSHEKIWYKTNLLNALTKAGREANCLYVVGNHDVGIKGVQGAPNSADYLLNPMECFDVLNRHYSKNPAIVYDEDNPFGGWYYLDDEKSKIRMIVLQSSDIFKADGSFVRYRDELMFMSQGQLTWFCEKACKLDKDDTTGWGIIVFMHNDKPYGTTNYSLFKILQAVKDGSTYTETFTVYNRMTLVDGNWTTTRDEVNGDTIEIDCDYTSQGAIDVLGVIHGHGHVDEATTYANINDIQVRCDNGFLDDYYIAPVEGITAGTYWFTDADGKKWEITYSSSYNDVAYIGYNYYFSHNNVSPMPISRYDSNMNRIRSNSGCSLISEAPAGATEVTGFVRERGNTRIGQESAEILCIDRENRTLTFIPYGTATKHIVSF